MGAERGKEREVGTRGKVEHGRISAPREGLHGNNNVPWETGIRGVYMYGEGMCMYVCVCGFVGWRA